MSLKPGELGLGGFSCWQTKSSGTSPVVVGWCYVERDAGKFVENYCFIDDASTDPNSNCGPPPNPSDPQPWAKGDYVRQRGWPNNPHDQDTILRPLKSSNEYQWADIDSGTAGAWSSVADFKAAVHDNYTDGSGVVVNRSNNRTLVTMKEQ